MSVNLYEIPITPVVDLDGDVVVYVPGYAKKGPLEPTIVTADTFKEVFGDTPYTFADGDTTSASGPANNILGKNAPDRGWLYAKGLLDAGLTVLYHRIPDKAETAFAKSAAVPVVSNTYSGGPPIVVTPSLDYSIVFQARFPGSFYSELSIAVEALKDEAQKILVYREDDAGESHLVQERLVSFDPESPLFIGKEGILNDIDILFYYRGTKVDNVVEEFRLNAIYHPTTGAAGYLRVVTPAETVQPSAVSKPTSYGLTMTEESSSTPEFTVAGLLKNLAGDTSTSPPTPSKLDALLDTDTYPTVTYITSGGYYQTDKLAKKMLEVADEIKAIALIDISGDVLTLQSTISGLGLDKLSAYTKGTSFVGGDTFKIYGDIPRIMADSYGYLTKLGENISRAIPPWVPVANVPQGVTSAVATTRPINFATRAMLIPTNNIGIAINPIYYKQNSGYTIMGNRTLAKLTGVTGPDAFLNCQLVVNSVLRSARRAAADLLIVSTSPTTAFSTFYSRVSKTCEKMLVNGDGLAAYNIIKLKKTKPATIDIQIELTLVEGIETFNIYVPYSIALDA